MKADMDLLLSTVGRRQAPIARGYRLCRENENLLAELEPEYVRLFVNAPHGNVAYLEATAYLANEGLDAQGDYMYRLSSVLTRAGIAPSADARQPSDHLAMLLECVYYELSNDPRPPGRLPFVEEFVAGWLPRFLRRLGDAGPHPFYVLVGSILTAVLNGDTRGETFIGENDGIKEEQSTMDGRESR